MKKAYKLSLLSFLTLPYIAVACGGVEDRTVEEGTGGSANAGSAGTAGGGGDAGSFDSGGEGGSGTGGAPQNEPGVGTFDGPCSPNGALACEGHAQALKLRCIDGKWAGNGECPTDEFCDTSEGNRGQCQPVPPECVDKDAGEAFCRDLDRIECGVDLVSVTVLESCYYGCRPTACSCPAGTEITDAEGAGYCAACEDAFSAENAEACTPWTDCIAGKYVSEPGTTTIDQQCAACAAGTYSATENTATCTTWSSCTPGQYVTQAGTSASDRQCAACPLGTISTAANAANCLPAQIAAGTNHTCALLTNGNVRCWGRADAGQLGYGNASAIGDNETPASAGNVSIGGLATQIVAGANHTCALLTDGSVRCWGLNEYGQIGYGNPQAIGDNETPASAGNVDVGGTVVQLAAGQAHTCARLANGSVRCWGLGVVGQLGYGNPTNIGESETPASAGNVNVGGTVTQIAAGGNSTCALLTGGNVRCWGFNGSGQLGYSNTSDIGDNETPASAGNVNVGGTVAQITLGGAHTCALLTNGNVRCWGSGNAGQLGHGIIDQIGDNEAPATAGDTNVGGTAMQITAGNMHNCALLTNGNVRCWGQGLLGKLGYGNTSDIGDNETPASAGNVTLGAAATFLAAGTDHTCAVLGDGNVRCWGDGLYGRLGYVNTNNIGDNETPASAGNVPFL